MLYVLLVGALAFLSWQFGRWFVHPWRCFFFGIFWTMPDGSVPHFRLVWCGWFVLVQETDKGWRGWKAQLNTD